MLHSPNLHQLFILTGSTDATWWFVSLTYISCLSDYGQEEMVKSIFTVPRFPQSLKSPWILGFPWKSPWKWICPWKVLEFRVPSLKFQLVVLDHVDFLFCVFWIESLNGYSKSRGTRANFLPKNLARFARSSLQVKYFSSSSCSYLGCSKSS